MFNMAEMVLILIVALVVFGPSKLPEVGKALGKGLSEFRRAMNAEPAREPQRIEISQAGTSEDAEKHQDRK